VHGSCAQSQVTFDRDLTAGYGAECAIITSQHGVEQGHSFYFALHACDFDCVAFVELVFH